MRFSPTISNVGQQVGDDVFDTLDVLGCEAAIRFEDRRGEVPGREEVCSVGWSVSAESSGLVQPPDSGRVVPQGEDARVDRVGVSCATPALEPHADYHPQEFEEVVDSRVSEDEAIGWDPDSLSLPCRETVSAHTERAGVGPTDSRRFSGGDQVYGHSLVCFDQERLPEFQVSDDFFW